MSYTKLRTRLISAALVAMACLVLSGWLGWRTAPVAAATPGTLETRMVYIDAQYRVDPVTITKVTVGDQQIQPGVSTGPREVRPGTPFQADEDWMKNMSIFLQNRTDKAIVRVEIEFVFPDTGDGSPSRPVTVYPMTFGQRPEIDSYASHGQKLAPEPDKQPLLFAPGQTLVFHVTDYVNAMQFWVEGGCGDFCSKIAFSQVTRVAIRRSRFYFADGMRWDDLHGFGVPDLDHPGEFTYLDRNRFFPGDPRNDWPPPTQQVAPGRRRSE